MMSLAIPIVFCRSKVNVIIHTLVLFVKSREEIDKLYTHTQYCSIK